MHLQNGKYLTKILIIHLIKFQPGQRKLFIDKYNANGIQEKYKHFLHTYNWIVAFEKFIGEGEYADLFNDDLNSNGRNKENYKVYIKGVQKKGLEIGSLSLKQLVS